MNIQTDKHAFLIMAGSYSKQLNILLKELDFVDNVIFVHVDLKCGEKSHKQLYTCSRASLMEIKRINSNWGSFSLVQVELNLLRIALQSGPFKYYHLLSESDLPIKSNRFIHEFFKDKDFQFVDIEGIDRKIDKRRIKYFFPLQEKIGKRHGFFWFIQKIFMYIQKLLGINRLSKLPFSQYAKGSEWFSITEDFAQYIISNESLIHRSFEKGQAVDELFIQTLLVNSDLKKSISDKGCGNLRFIHWSKGNSPDTLTKSADFDNLISSRAIFARKFDILKSQTLIKKIINNRKDY